MASHIFKVWVDSDGDVDQGQYLISNTVLGKLNTTIERVYSNRVNAFAKNPRRIQELVRAIYSIREIRAFPEKLNIF